MIVTKTENGLTQTYSDRNVKIHGVIDISHIPAAALERLVKVADKTARLALTIKDVQKGDSVQ